VVVDADLAVNQLLVDRALADHIDEPAGIGRAIEHGGRPLEHLDTLEEEGVDLEVAERIAEEIEVIEEEARLAGIETANIDPVRVRVGAEGLGEDAGRIA
jgi:hypothetical protein